MSRKLPNEVILRVSALLSKESSLDLKPLTLVNHQWHNVVAPALLSTISVSSLRDLVEMCDHLMSFDKHLEDTRLSSIMDNTKTIVIAGVIWGGDVADSHVGLEDLGEVARGDDEDGDPAEPDINIPFDEVSSKIREALPLLTKLNGLEWYGRFAGDYHLVRYLQKANVIQHLAYGIDMQVSSVSVGKH
jgi:hypothetical protein